MSRFGERLQAARKRVGMTQADLAAAIGTTQPHLSNLESGSADPHLTTILAIARALEISPSELIDDLPES